MGIFTLKLLTRSSDVLTKCYGSVFHKKYGATWIACDLSQFSKELFGSYQGRRSSGRV